MLRPLLLGTPLSTDLKHLLGLAPSCSSGPGKRCFDWRGGVTGKMEVGFENRVLKKETHCKMQHEEELGVQESET